MPYKVSIALTTYNGQRFIEEQIDSVLAQNYPLHEIIICDDCSVDSTRTLLRKYSARLPNLIKLYENEHNLGYIKNFEKALSLCTGEYIALADQDDVWDCNKINALISSIGDSDAIHSDARLIDSNGQLLSDSFCRYSRKKVRNLGFIDLFMNNSVTGCTMMVRQSIIQYAIPFPSSLPHDHWLALLATDRNGLSYYPGTLLSYRQHEGNVLGAGINKRYQQGKSSSGRSRDEIFRSRINKITDLIPISAHAFSPKNHEELKSLLSYYQSFFRNTLRPSAFLFYLSHLSAFSRNKNLFQILYGLANSLLGKKYIHELGKRTIGRQGGAAKSIDSLPLCTVMIPTYNQAAYLKRTIDSALAQDYQNLEVIVANDASTDETAELLAGYYDTRLRWHTNRPNLGRVANYRDLLVNHARGDWVVNLDGDDFFIDPTFISSSILAALKNPDAVIVFADRHEMPHPIEDIPAVKNAVNAKAETFSGMDYIRSWPKTKKRIHHLTAVYNREKALITDFYTENIISSDYDSLFRLMVHGDVIHLPAKVAVWRYHSQNASTNKTVAQKIDDLRWIEHVAEYVSAQKPAYSETMRHWLHRNVAHRYYGFLLSSIRSGDRNELKQLEKEIDARYPGVNLRILVSPITWIKLAYHRIRKLCS